eukprot:CAMPEP_0183744442 /NCGR_PEP_ID=MMETSP0737-20130205/65733_1 /TAXON_ID=385413 /ORGANISM="Thalassiosira miniscula, Strain CCMP1093" /LENGTH=373 /DNA_ID=CAMNT_0025980083 /DNA_START=57 /DNA_END=1178 /DNA_ORIENTATION=-
MIVVGNINDALAAAMALCVQDVLSTTITPPQEMHKELLKERQRSPVPPAQPIAFFHTQTPSVDQDSDGQSQQQMLSSETISSLQNSLLFLGPSSIDGFEQVVANALQLLSRISDEDPMLHTSIDFGCAEGSETMHSLSMTRDRFSFLGLNLKTTTLSRNKSDNDDGRFLMSRESAGEWGNRLHTLLDGSHASAAVTMDIRTHLALLQANSLPRSRGVLGGETDRWAITDNIQDGMHVDNGDGLLLEYQFNYNDPFGGCDPLLCPSVGSIVPSPSPSQSQSNLSHKEANNDAYAAAYSAMIGSGADFLEAVCIATSVKAIFRELGRSDGNELFCPPPYTWKVIDKIAEYSLKAGENVRQEDGLSRKMYKEFGYR